MTSLLDEFKERQNAIPLGHVRNIKFVENDDYVGLILVCENGTEFKFLVDRGIIVSETLGFATVNLRNVLGKTIRSVRSYKSEIAQYEAAETVEILYDDVTNSNVDEIVHFHDCWNNEPKDYMNKRTNTMMMQKLNQYTGNGTLIKLYNDHNGYYPHEICVTYYDGTKIWEEKTSL